VNISHPHCPERAAQGSPYLSSLLPMASCTGCSRPFKYLQSGQRCGRCSRLAAGHASQWPQCSLCGSVFEFLDGAVCHACAEYGEFITPQPELLCQGLTLFRLEAPGGIGEVAQDAVANPVNPRTHTSRGAAPIERTDDPVRSYPLALH
jgi:hypothetical protein